MNSDTTNNGANTMSIAAKIENVLKSGGVAVKEVWCGRLTGIATFYSFDMAKRAARLFQAASITAKGPGKGLDQTKGSEGIKPEYVEVYRVWLTF
jgi:hypothetical protein